jgi:hypothetical protein
VSRGLFTAIGRRPYCHEVTRRSNTTQMMPGKDATPRKDRTAPANPTSIPLRLASVHMAPDRPKMDRMGELLSAYGLAQNADLGMIADAIISDPGCQLMTTEADTKAVIEILGILCSDDGALEAFNAHGGVPEGIRDRMVARIAASKAATSLPPLNFIAQVRDSIRRAFATPQED